MTHAQEVFEIAAKNKPAKVTIKAEFIQFPGESGGLYRVYDGYCLGSSMLTIDAHGNYRLTETMGFHSAPLVNGQIIEVTI